MKISTSLIASAWLLAAPANGAVKVFACEPEWANLVELTAGDLASVYQASTAMQDPHRIEARPSLIAQMRRAQLVICTGADLEVGWLPLLMQSAGNRDVYAGSPRFIAAAELVSRLEVPTTVDRAAGDIHPGGNPHVHLDPHKLAEIAQAVAERLAIIDAANAEEYRARYAAFAQSWRDAIAGWETKAQPLRGMRIVPYHKDTVYLAHWLGLVEVMNIEPKPGLPPSAAHLAGLVDLLVAAPVDAVTRSAYQDPKPMNWLRAQTGVPTVELPYTVGGAPDVDDLYALFDVTIDRLLEARGRHDGD